VSSRKRLPSEVTSYSNWLFTGDDIEVRFGRAALTRVGVLLYQTVLSDEGPVPSVFDNIRTALNLSKARVSTAVFDNNGIRTRTSIERLAQAGGKTYL
jgi:hypothetical protein